MHTGMCKRLFAKNSFRNGGRGGPLSLSLPLRFEESLSPSSLVIGAPLDGDVVRAGSELGELAKIDVTINDYPYHKWLSMTY